jgi:hypothetical protein
MILEDPASIPDPNWLDDRIKSYLSGKHNPVIHFFKVTKILDLLSHCEKLQRANVFFLGYDIIRRVGLLPGENSCT